jgi:Nitrous oxide-stimulated promoter
MGSGHERKTLRAMVRLFCRKRHGGRPLCDDCRSLLDYAEKRLDRCPYANDKPTCQQCPTHCYAHEMRDRVAEIMRFSGPRMIWYHPIMAIRHLIHARRSK